MNYKDFFDSLKDMNVLVIGDLMMDQYLWGSIDRISPEAPVPILSLSGRENRLGGAANVAINVMNLGANVYVCGVVGKDAFGSFLMDRFEQLNLDRSGILQSSTRETTVKTRVIAGRHQMLRIDQEQTDELCEEDERCILDTINKLFTIRNYNAIIIQDYNKGLLTKPVIKAILEKARIQNSIIGVDPKNKHFYAYKGVDLLKPNLKEIKENVPFDVAVEEKSLIKASKFIKNKLGHRFTMITLSDEGLFFYGSNGGEIFNTRKRTVADVCGAGDAVIAIATLCLAAKMDEEDIAVISNIAGGQVCEKVGVVPMESSMVISEFLQKVIV